MGAATVALLTFNRNDSERSLRLVRRLSAHVDEVVVVDSSSPDQWTTLVGGLHGPKEHAVRAIPTGYADLLQPLGVDEVGSDWVFYCDPDEEPSPGLLRRIAHPDGADAYVVPRWEKAVKAFTPHLRLYRRACFLAPDPAYAFPGIRGTVEKLTRSECLVHHRDYRDALAGDYSTRVMDLESYERPVDRRWFRSAVIPQFSSQTSTKGSPTPSAISPSLSGPGAALAAGFVAVRELARSGSPAWAGFQWRYHRTRALYEERLPADERRRRAAINQATRAGGGLIRFLGFDDPRYVRSLSAMFTWDVDGIEVLHQLIDYRFERGAPMSQWNP